LAFIETVGSATADIWVLSVGNEPVTVHPFLETGADERYPEFSPDGRWIAYVSDESGRNEVYVRPYPGPGPRHTVSTNRGTQPAWTRNGRELVYTEPGTGTLRMMSVDVTTTGTTFTAQQPRLLFEGRYDSVTPVRGYDVTPDGKRFLMPQRGERPEPPITQIALVQNWLEELKRLVPTQ
jgi:Tol biopolymer transport system component